MFCCFLSDPSAACLAVFTVPICYRFALGWSIRQCGGFGAMSAWVFVLPQGIEG